VQALATAPGISLRANVEDLPGEVARHAVVVLPFVSGGGIKNKLLEAAAMGKVIVSTRRGRLGLVGDAPVVEANGAGAFSEAVISLWSDPQGRQKAGAQLREWVEQHHDWATVATMALTRLATRGSDVRVRLSASADTGR
jgi:glycosyltransferase involved in cell wall biosynthesis